MPFKDPEKHRQYQRDRRAKLSAARRAAKALPAPPAGPPAPPVEPLPLATAADALAVMREQVNAVRAGGDYAACRTISYAVAVSLKAIELTDIAARLAVLEAEAAARRGGGAT